MTRLCHSGGNDSPLPGGRERRRAFSLVEVTLALGVASFSLLAILGLLHTGLTTEKATIGQTVASGILSTVFSDIASTPGASSVTQMFQLSLAGTDSAAPQTLYFSEDGKPTGLIGTVPTASSLYRVSVGIPPVLPASPPVVRIFITWPAAADPDPAQWPTRASGSIEVVTALDRS